MAADELGKEQYRSIIITYFQAFGTRDFSSVKLSSNIQFLSPISRTTMNGRGEVVKFLSGVASRACFRGEYSINYCRLPDGERCMANDDNKGCAIYVKQLLSA